MAAPPTYTIEKDGKYEYLVDVWGHRRYWLKTIMFGLWMDAIELDTFTHTAVGEIGSR